MLEETRTERVSAQVEYGDLNINTGKRVVNRATNKVEKEERILSIVAVMREAEDLKLAACDVDTALAKLRHKVDRVGGGRS